MLDVLLCSKARQSMPEQGSIYPSESLEFLAALTVANLAIVTFARVRLALIPSWYLESYNALLNVQEPGRGLGLRACLGSLR